MTEQANQLEQAAAELAEQWKTDPRWAGVQRTYSAADVVKLRGSVVEERRTNRRTPLRGRGILAEPARMAGAAARI
ncbi:hypothetical protein ABT279_14345, partial [Amycolatopsis sp. NPDC000673]